MNMGEKKTGFCITGGKGFHMTFENNWTISVQFGPGNYCDNYGVRISEEGRRESGERGSSTAEVAVWGPDGNLIDLEGDSVLARQTPEQVLVLMNNVAKR